MYTEAVIGDLFQRPQLGLGGGRFSVPPVRWQLPPPKSVDPPPTSGLVEENLNRSPSRLGPVDGSCGAANTNFCKQLLGYSRVSAAKAAARASRC